MLLKKDKLKRDCSRTQSSKHLFALNDQGCASRGTDASCLERCSVRQGSLTLFTWVRVLEREASGQGFSASATLTFGTRSFFIVGPSCALQGVEHPPLTPGDNQKCLETFLSVSPGDSPLVEHHRPVSSQLTRCQGSPPAYAQAPLLTGHLLCFKLILGTEDSMTGKPGGAPAVNSITPLTSDLG